MTEECNPPPPHPPPPPPPSPSLSTLEGLAKTNAKILFTGLQLCSKLQIHVRVWSLLVKHHSKTQATSQKG